MELMTFFMLTLPISIALWTIAVACASLLTYSIWSLFK